MKKCALIFLLGNIFLFSGCLTMFEDYDYSISFENIGSRKIWVEDFNIYKNTRANGAGILIPYAKSSSSPYLEKPYSSVWMQWCFMKGNEPYGKSYGKTVYINLPKEFDKKHGNKITFYINPDKNNVIVSYGIITDFNEYKEINSDGSRFQLPKTPKKKLSQKE